MLSLKKNEELPRKLPIPLNGCKGTNIFRNLQTFLIIFSPKKLHHSRRLSSMQDHATLELPVRENRAQAKND
jgi:hypothetical protein